MSEHYSLGNDPIPLTPDRYFQDRYVISPMVVMFCLLPFTETDKQAVVMIDEGWGAHTMQRNLMVSGGSMIEAPNFTVRKPCPVPAGMCARRILLFYFAQFYLNRKFVHNLEGRRLIEYIDDYGYTNHKGRQRKRYETALMHLVNSHWSFSYDDDNALYGFTRKDQLSDKIFSGRVDNYRLKSLYANKEFLFNTAFPVDLDHLRTLRKKSFFWNVYLFLVDVIPRVPEDKHVWFPWRFLKKILGRNYKNVNHFKQDFKKCIPEMEDLYPAVHRRLKADTDKLYILRGPPLVPPPEPIYPDTPVAAGQIYRFNVA